MMRPNAFFPSLDIGTDPAKIRDWAQAAEDLGYHTLKSPITSSAQRAEMAGFRFTMRRILSTRPLSCLAFWPRLLRPSGCPPEF